MRLSSRSAFALLATASLGLLAAGLLVGELAKLQPCHLCNLQRLIYLVLAFFALCGVLLPDWRKLWSLLVALTAAGGGGLPRCNRAGCSTRRNWRPNAVSAIRR